MKYDDATYHADATHTPEQCAVFISLFLAWAAEQGMLGRFHEEVKDELLQREVTPGEFFIHNSDCQLTNEDFNDEGNQFAQWYYERRYTSDLLQAFPSADLFAMEDSWSSVDQITPTLDQRLAYWRAHKN
ncbi:MAG: hypothetical protein QM758_21045 [Armatimonas sp.]